MSPQRQCGQSYKEKFYLCQKANPCIPGVASHVTELSHFTP